MHFESFLFKNLIFQFKRSLVVTTKRFLIYLPPPPFFSIFSIISAIETHWVQQKRSRKLKWSVSTLQRKSLLYQPEESPFKRAFSRPSLKTKVIQVHFVHTRPLLICVLPSPSLLPHREKIFSHVCTFFFFLLSWELLKGGKKNKWKIILHCCDLIFNFLNW